MNPEGTPGEVTGSTEIPPSVRETADRLSRDHERSMQQSLESYDKSVHDILEKGRAEIRRLVGPANWPVLRRLMRRERLTWRERMQPPEGPFRDLPAEIRARKEAAVKFLDGIGVSPDRLRQTVETYSGYIDRLSLVPATRPGQAYPLPGHEDKLRDLLAGPLQAGHQWFCFRPPFEDGYRASYVLRSPTAYRVGAYPEAELDVDSGRIRQRMFLSIVDAGDLDTVRGVLDTAVEFAFTAPMAGQVEVLVEATCGAALHELKVEDEWGVSWSVTEQKHSWLIHVLHPNVAGPLADPELSRVKVNTDESVFYAKEVLVRGWDYFGTWTPDGHVSAGDTMVIRVGMRSDDATMTNDMGISSTSTFEWMLKRVCARIAPSP